MEGVTTAIVAFIFACLIWPHIVKNKPQFYSALGMLMIIILFDAIGHMATEGPLHHVMYVLAALLQMLTILLLVLSVGGLTVRQLGFEVQQTIEAIRKGDDRPVLVPLKGEQPMPRKTEDEPASTRINLTPDVPPPPKPQDSGSIPLE